MSDDFEKAVLFAFDHSGSVSPELKAQAASLLESAAASPEVWRFCLSRAESSAYDQVKFWCLQTLHAFINGPNYRQATSSDLQSRAELKTTLVSMGTTPNSVYLPPFIRNKIAQAVVAIAAQEYPSSGWPTFFQDVLGTLSQGPQAVDFLCRILVSIDEDIVSLEVPRSAEEAKRGSEFKDAMRATALQELASAWTRLVGSYKDTAPDLTAAILAAVQRYVHWVDISLVANDDFITLLYSILDKQTGDSEQAQQAAAGVLIEIVSKRMEPIPKLSLIQSLRLTPVCASWGTGRFPGLDDDRGGGGGGGGDISLGDLSLAIQFSKLLASLATEILESLKKVENSVLSMQAVGLEVGEDAVREAEGACFTATSLLDSLFPAILKAVKAGDDEITASIAPFLLSYVARVRLARKRDPTYQPGHIVANILDAVATGSRFPDDSAVMIPSQGTSDFCELTAAEEEAAMADRRQELFTIFRNAAKLAPEVAVATVAQRMRPALSIPDAPWQDVELAVSLLFQLGEGGITHASTALAIDAVMGAAGISTASSHHLVALALLETCTRYAKSMAAMEAKASNAPEMVVRAVGLFLGPIGLGHRSYDVVQPRAAYLLCRTVKTLRSFLQPFTGDLLQSLHPHLIAAASQRFYVQGALPASVAGATAQRNALGTGIALVEDRLYVFEAAGLLIAAEEVPVDTQVGWLNTVTQPLVAGLSGDDSILVQQCLDALNKTCKGFSPRLLDGRPQLAAQLVDPLDQAVEAVRKNQRLGHVREVHKTFRAKFLAYLHRLIETVPMPLISKRLPAVLWVLHSTVRDAADLADVLLLLNQVMVSTKEKGPELENVLRQGGITDCMDRVWEMLGSDAHEGNVGTMTNYSIERQSSNPTAAGSREDVREKGELQRSYFAFLHSVVQTDLGDIILARPRALEDLAQGGTIVGDLSVRKLCIATLGKLALRREHPSFFMHRFGVQVLLGGLTNTKSNGIDVRDAAAISLLTEVATQMQSLYKNCFDNSDEYLRCLVANQMVASWPGDVKERLEFLVKGGGDPKQLKDFLKQVILRGVS